MAAVAGEASARHPRQRLVVVALALSLALNVCFVGGAVWARLNLPLDRMDKAHWMQAVASRLDLDPQQQTAFEEYSRTVHARSKQMHEEIDPLFAEAWTEIGKPQPNEAQLGQDFDDALVKRRAFQHDVTAQTLTFLKVLSPEQRARFVEMARERYPSWAKRTHHR